MLTVEVDLLGHAYRVLVGRGLLNGKGPTGEITALLQGRKVVLVSDETVYGLHGPLAESWLDANGARVLARSVMKPGEANKNLAALGRIWDDMVESGLERSGLLVAFGGGVTGDVAGFAAATYLRGVDFIQVPTTLLAMVDSSVGGKTGIDHPRGKNLIGAFHQPKAVVADIDLLETLPSREVHSGLAEAIKAAVIGDPVLFDLLEEKGPAIIRQPDALLETVGRAVAVKAAVVGEDEREGGKRALLNLGHTVGHAIEAASGFGGPTHGEAVGTGLLFAVRASLRLGLIERAPARRIEKLLEDWGYPAKAEGLSPAEIKKAMGFDKKKVSGSTKWVLPRDIGRVDWGMDIDEVTVDLLLAEMQG